MIIRNVAFICVLFLIFSCSSNNNPEKGSANKASEDHLNKRAAVLGIIHGGWVLQENIRKLDSLLPLSKAFPYGQAYPELIIDTSEMYGDTIPNYGCLANGKEGHHFKLVFEKGTKPLRMLFHHNYAEENFFIDYTIVGNDTLLVMTKGNIETPDHQMQYYYHKVYSTPPSNDYNINPSDFFINQKLFSGTYELKSPTNAVLNKDVVLESSGKISRFKDFHHYYVNHQYHTFPHGNQDMDYIMFYLPDSTIDLAYQKEKETIRLYHIEKDLRSGLRKKGSLAYSLVLKSR